MGSPDRTAGLTGAVVDALAGVARGAPVLIAVSGGADSVALAHLVRSARPDLATTVGHVRHGLRDDAPDAAAAARAASALGMGLIQRDVVVGVGDGPEDAARRARRDALVQMARAVGADVVLLGHTADDQAETVLLRLARGTGPDGLAGMSPETGWGGVRIIRPLLSLRRADVRRAAPAGTWVEDPTNADPDQRRARARHVALPAVGRLRPDDGDAVPALVRLADLARADREVLDQLVADVVLQRYGPAVLVPRDGVVPGLRARLLRRAWRLLDGPAIAPPARLVDRVLALPEGSSCDAPGGVRVTASSHGWVLDPHPDAVPPTVSLPVGGAVELPWLGITVSCTVADPAEDVGPAAPGAPGDVAGAATGVDPAPWVLAVPVCDGPLVLSTRGAVGGARDVRDALRLAVPVGLRHLVPILRGADGRALAIGSRGLVRPPEGGSALSVTAVPVSPGRQVG